MFSRPGNAPITFEKTQFQRPNKAGAPKKDFLQGSILTRPKVTRLLGFTRVRVLRWWLLMLRYMLLFLSVFLLHLLGLLRMSLFHLLLLCFAGLLFLHLLMLFFLLLLELLVVLLLLGVEFVLLLLIFLVQFWIAGVRSRGLS